jgi:hypothetical protein
MSQLSARLSARGTLLKICYTVAAVFVAADSFDCGQPLGPCGEAVPAGVTCPKGAGWCTAGYYCGRDRKGDSKVKCMHLPENCGTAGYDCCPSNAETPHTSDTDTSNRTPFCKDGSTCVFNPDSRWTSISPDPHEGVRGEPLTGLTKRAVSVRVLLVAASADTQGVSHTLMRLHGKDLLAVRKLYNGIVSRARVSKWQTVLN